jgi:hypothetical protein
MSSFDPATVRKAVAEFTPRRPQKFQDLLPARDVIVELRQKRGSYRAIAQLLTQHCLPTSKTAVALFCHELLGEIVRPHKRTGRKRTPAPASPTSDGPVPAALPPADVRPQTEPSANPDGGEDSPSRVRGPRIAQVRMLKSQDK